MYLQVSLGRLQQITYEQKLMRFIFSGVTTAQYHTFKTNASCDFVINVSTMTKSQHFHKLRPPFCLLICRIFWTLQVKRNTGYHHPTAMYHLDSNFTYTYHKWYKPHAYRPMYSINFSHVWLTNLSLSISNEPVCTTNMIHLEKRFLNHAFFFHKFSYKFWLKILK